MPGTVGGELGQLQSLKRTFDKNSQEVQQLSSAIAKQLESTWWKGGAADRFRNAWNSEFSPALKKLQQALQEAGHEVQRRHDALERAGS